MYRLSRSMAMKITDIQDVYDKFIKKWSKVLVELIKVCSLKWD